MAIGRRMTNPPKKKPVADGKLSIPNIADRGAIVDHDASSRGAVALSLGLLSHVPYSVTGASNVFGIGSEHPFANYWTCEGGLPEVISVLPEKIQADILLARYFECVERKTKVKTVHGSVLPISLLPCAATVCIHTG